MHSLSKLKLTRTILIKKTCIKLKLPDIVQWLCLVHNNGAVRTPVAVEKVLDNAALTNCEGEINRCDAKHCTNHRLRENMRKLNQFIPLHWWEMCTYKCEDTQ